MTFWRQGWPSRRQSQRHSIASRPAQPISLECLEVRRLLTTYFVSTTGLNSNPGTLAEPFGTIQHALDVAARPGDTVEVRAGAYHEMLTLPHSGSARGGFITLEAYPGERPIIDGANAPSDDVGYGNVLVQIINQSYVRVSGFEIAYGSGVAVGDDAFGVRVQGAGSNVIVSHNVIHDITGQVLSSKGADNTGYGGAGIHVYGSSLTSPYSDVVIDHNTIYGCQPGDDETETLTVNGNVTRFRITRNVIHDDNNIGIDMIGGEADVFGKPSGTLGLPVARDGVCSGNTVCNIHANYGGGFAGGIYIDGGQDILVSRNVTYQNDLGLEVGSENNGYVASGNVIEDNLVYRNTQGGLVLGGYQASVGRVRSCSFLSNTVYGNDSLHTGSGQLLIQYALGNTITSNIFDAADGDLLIGSAGAGNSGNLLNHNLYFAASASAAEFDWNADSYDGLSAYQTATGEDLLSLFADPRFRDPAHGDFWLARRSPALGLGAGVSGQYDPADFTGSTRTLPPNAGAY